MPDLIALLQDVLAGHDADRAVLHNCALDGAGVSIYGREAILEFFRGEAREPNYVQVNAARRGAVLFAPQLKGAVALFADLHEGRIMRLYYLASGPVSQRPADRIDIPSDLGFGDPDTPIAFEAADHPELNPAHLPRVKAWSERFLGDGSSTPPELTGLSRVRIYVLRAFSEGEHTALLAAIVAHRSDGRPGLVRFSAAVRLVSDLPAQQELVIDEGERQSELAHVWRAAF